MSGPRRIRPGATYAISRRVEGRRFLLRPDDALTQLFTWLLAVMAARFDIRVHVAVVMSTHFHLVVTDPRGNISKVMGQLDGLLSKSLKVLRSYVQGVVWEPGGLSIVELVTVEAVVEQIAYAIANPVEAGLVTHSAQWPGLTARVEDLGVRVYQALRPGWFFRPLKKWPALARLRLTLPECLEALGVERAQALVHSELARQERAARAKVAANGWRVPGPVGVKSVSPYRRATSWRELGKLRPAIAAGRGQVEARVAALRDLVAFRRTYRAALERWRAGERDVVFPHGTYAMAVWHGVRVARPPAS